MLVVLDTNVLVSALLTPHGTPARVLDLALAGEIRLAFDDRILAEYRDVLARPKFGFSRGDVSDLLTALEADGEHIIPRPIHAKLPDKDDLPFLEVAAFARAPLITGNTAHFPASARGGVDVYSPAAFVKMWKM